MNTDRRSGWRTGRWVLLGCLALALFPMLAPMPADAQTRDLQPVFDRLDRLERDIRTLNQQIARPGSVPPAAAAAAMSAQPLGGDASGDALGRLDSRMSALEDDMRAMTGRDEELSHRISQLEARLDKLVSDVDFRLTALEQGGTREPTSDLPSADAGMPPPPRTAPNGAPVLTPPRGAGNPSAVPSQSGVLGTIPQSRLNEQQANTAASPGPANGAPASRAPALPPGTPQDQYAYAQQFLFSQKYDEAEKTFTAFLAAHPNDPLSGNARYWLGETYYVRKDYAKAAETFLDGWQKDPKGSKAPDSLLKLAMSLANLNKSKEACAAFDKLRSDYPNAQGNIDRLAAKERQQSGCR